MYSRLCEASEIAEDPFKAKPIWQKSPPPPSPPVTWPGNVLDSYKQVIRRLHSRQLSGCNVNSSCKGEKPDKSIICLLSTCWKSTHYTVQTWMKAAGAFWTWKNFLRPVKSQWLSFAFPLAECCAFQGLDRWLGWTWPLPTQGIKSWTDSLFCLVVSATWSSRSVDSRAFQWEDRSFNSQIEQQRSAYGVVAASKK